MASARRAAAEGTSAVWVQSKSRVCSSRVRLVRVGVRAKVRVRVRGRGRGRGRVRDTKR